MPTVSVIVPNYNHARYLRQRIDSVLEQTYQDFEVILLDDCSTDNSLSIIDQYRGDPRVRIELNDKNSGSTFKQWNEGVRLARGRYVWIAESDDYADKRLLERLVALLDEDQEVTFAYCRCWEISADDQKDRYGDGYLDHYDAVRWKTDFRADGREECRNYFVRTNPVPNASAVVFCRAIYERVGGADEKLYMCGDWKLWAAMALEGKIAYLGEPLNYYRAHDASVRSKSKRVGLDASEGLQVIRWILDRVTPTEPVREDLCAMAAFYWVPALLSLRVPLSVKRAILKDVTAIDPHAMANLVHHALVLVRLMLSKELRSARQLFSRRTS